MRMLPLIALVSCACAHAEAPVRIELLPSAQATGDIVLLGEVARLHAEGLDLMRRLVHLPLGRAPVPGQAGVLQRDALADWVQRQAGLAPASIAWSGAVQAQVQRPASRLRGEAIAQAAVAAVQEAMSASGARAEVQVRVTPRDLELPASELRLQARALEGAQLRRRAVVWVDVWAGAGMLRSVPVPVEIAREPAPLVVTGSASLPQEGNLAVARGEWAVLRTAAGAVALESRVEVLQDGREGDKVRVRASGAAAPMFARVAGRGVLELAP